MTEPDTAGPLLEVRDLRKQYERTKGWMRRVQGIVKAVDGVSFDVQRGETLSLVGESGCGKTTTGRCIVRGIEPTSGEILFDDGGQRRDLVTMGARELAVARQKIRMVFQDPFASLNSRMTVLQIVGEPLLINGRARGKDDVMEQVVALLRLVQLDPRYVGRYPNAFSGGQRQRIAIARALALDPKLVIADEPVSALDVSVQAQILNLMKDLQQEKGLTYLFVAHNLAVVRYQSDRIAVMYLGRIVELSTRDEIFERPLHPYTEMLLLSSPTPDPRARRRAAVVVGDVPDPAKRPAGCAFNPRCRFAQDICRSEEPPLVDAATGDGPPHQVACHFWEKISLEAG